MATDLNRVLLVGRLTRDPELRQTNSGTSYCRFSIASNRNYSVNGERREEVSFFNCVAWSKQAEIINQYCRKGKQVAIDGRLQQRSWENQEGKKQSSVDIVVESLQMLGAPTGSGSGGGAGGGGSSDPYGEPVPPGDDGFSQYAPPGGGAPASGGYPFPDDDDDIPF